MAWLKEPRDPKTPPDDLEALVERILDSPAFARATTAKNLLKALAAPYIAKGHAIPKKKLSRRELYALLYGRKTSDRLIPTDTQKVGVAVARVRKLLNEYFSTSGSWEPSKMTVKSDASGYHLTFPEELDKPLSPVRVIWEPYIAATGPVAVIVFGLPFALPTSVFDNPSLQTSLANIYIGEFIEGLMRFLHLVPQRSEPLPIRTFANFGRLPDPDDPIFSRHLLILTSMDYYLKILPLSLSYRHLVEWFESNNGVITYTGDRFFPESTEWKRRTSSNRYTSETPVSACPQTYYGLVTRIWHEEKCVTVVSCSETAPFRDIMAFLTDDAKLQEVVPKLRSIFSGQNPIAWQLVFEAVYIGSHNPITPRPIACRIITYNGVETRSL